jgi:putative hydrolase of the HAD superfamily
MLGDFPLENYELLLQMKNRYRTFLFSNTNETHLDFYFRKLKAWYGIDDMDPLFEKTYYSCRLGLRKPDVEGFQHIIAENNLNPAETLFIDDSIQHVEGARKAGLRAFHLQKPMTLKEVLILNGLLQ